MRAILLLLALLPALLCAQPLLQVEGNGLPRARSYDAAALEALPWAKASATHKDAVHTWRGTPLADLLKDAGAVHDKALRGNKLTQVVVVHARDGYRVVFGLADVMFNDAGGLLVWEVDGGPLAPRHGPLRLVISDETPAARWVHQVERIEVRTLD